MSSQNIKNTMMTPGWEEIKQKALNRIEIGVKAAMTTRDEAEVVKLHRAAWAAHDALIDFIQDLEDEQGV